VQREFLNRTPENSKCVGLDYEYTNAVKIVKLMTFPPEKMQRATFLQLSVVSETHLPDLPRECSMMTHKYMGCIVVLLINKSVKPNEKQKVLTSSFDQGFTVNTSKRVFRNKIQVNKR
jgi:hypothetical protein